jgi:catalase
MKSPDKVETPPLKTTKGLSLEDLPKSGVKGMKFGFLAGPDADTKALKTMREAAENAGALVEVIAMDLSPVAGIKPDKTLWNTPSAVYDAIYVVGGGDKVADLENDSDATRFVQDAYKHGKAVAGCGNASTFVATVLPKSEGITPETQDGGVVLSPKHPDKAFVAEFIAAAGDRHWNRSPQKLPKSPANTAPSK